MRFFNIFWWFVTRAANAVKLELSATFVYENTIPGMPYSSWLLPLYIFFYTLCSLTQTTCSPDLPRCDSPSVNTPVKESRNRIEFELTKSIYKRAKCERPLSVTLLAPEFSHDSESRNSIPKPKATGWTWNLCRLVCNGRFILRFSFLKKRLTSYALLKRRKTWRHDVCQCCLVDLATNP